MDELTFKEKTKIPVELLLDPQTGRAAAYSDNHRLLAALASEKLIAHVQASPHSQQAWDESKWDPTDAWRPMPEWATKEVRARCVLLRMELDHHDDEALRAVPRK